MPLIMQEISTERYIEIPEEVREVYKLWRPTPFIRARRLEKRLTRRHTFTSSTKVSVQPGRTSLNVRSASVLQAKSPAQRR